MLYLPKSGRRNIFNRAVVRKFSSVPAGVSKTTPCLRPRNPGMGAGVDVIVGVVETVAAPRLKAKLQGLEVH